MSSYKVAACIVMSVVNSNLIIIIIWRFKSKLIILVIRVVIFVSEFRLGVVLSSKGMFLARCLSDTGLTLCLKRLLHYSRHWFTVWWKWAEVCFVVINRLGDIDWCVLADIYWSISYRTLFDTRLIINYFMPEWCFKLLALSIHVVSLEGFCLYSATKSQIFLLCCWQIYLW